MSSLVDELRLIELREEEKRIQDPKEKEYKMILSRYDDPKLFGDFIFRLRQKYGWSRKSIAKKLGFSSESSILNFERGTTIMKAGQVARFCLITPDKITLPILYSMFDNDSLEPPCRCVCHQDLNNSIPSIYNEQGECNLCNHSVNGGQFSQSGHWYEYSENEEEEE